MHLHLLIFTTFLQPKTSFYGLNNGTNDTEKDVSRNESHPFYNIDQDYSNMTNFYRLPPFIFKRDVDEFPATVLTTKRTEQLMPSIQATIHQQMTNMTKKVADDIAENLVLNIPVTKNQTRMADNDTTDHANSTQQLVANSSLVDLSLASVPATVVTTKRTEQVTRANNATTQQQKNDMVKKVAKSIAENLVLNIPTPKNQTRMAGNDTTQHANSTQQLVANSSLVDLSLPSVPASVVTTKRTEQVTRSNNATTQQQKNDMVKKVVESIAENLILNIPMPKNQTRMAGNETTHHASSTQQHVANSSLVDLSLTSVRDSFVSTKRTDEVMPSIHTTTHQHMNDMAKKIVNGIAENLVLDILGLKYQTQMAGNETSVHANSTQHLVANSSLVDLPLA